MMTKAEMEIAITNLREWLKSSEGQEAMKKAQESVKILQKDIDDKAKVNPKDLKKHVDCF